MCPFVYLMLWIEPTSTVGSFGIKYQWATVFIIDHKLFVRHHLFFFFVIVVVVIICTTNNSDNRNVWIGSTLFFVIRF